MSRRPADWSPLAGSDPVPGDPDDVERLADRFRSAALEIERQARMLTTLARRDGWEGEAGKVFAEEAGELAGKLAKTHGRYAKVSMQLRRWAPELRDAQREADQALTQAKDAEARQRANAGSSLDGVAEPTPEQQAADRRRQHAHDEAVQDLARARQRLDRAVDGLDRHAGNVADAIRDASDDDVKDGFWDKVKGFVSDHVGIIKIIAQVASWVALGLAVAAIVFSAPISLLVIAAVSAVAVTAKLALAATDNGSWADFGLEAFSLVTLGVGGLLTKGALKAAGALRGAAATVAGQRATAQVLAQHKTALTVVRVMTRTRIPLGPVRGLAARHGARIVTRADDAGRAAAQAVLRAPLPKTTLWQRLYHLDASLAQHNVASLALRRRFASAEVAQHMADLQRRIWQAQAVGGAGIAVDLYGKAKDVYAAGERVVQWVRPLKPRYTLESRPLR